MQSETPSIFKWGEWDCLVYVAQEAGLDISHFGPRKYTNNIGAAFYIKRNGFNNLAQLVDSLLPSRPVGFARRGDILLKEGCLGICKGSYGLFLTESSGLTRVSTFECERAWAS